jgi:hypothetical protein
VRDGLLLLCEDCNMFRTVSGPEQLHMLKIPQDGCGCESRVLVPVLFQSCASTDMQYIDY